MNLKLFKLTVALLCMTVALLASSAFAFELTGNVSVETTLFPKSPLYPGQEHNSGAAALQPELYHEFKDGSSIIAVPFLRVDSADNERTHFDLRELNYLYVADWWEARIGIGRVFWGVTESVHLVDIVNQTDFVESFDGDDKLGQPMISLSLPTSSGTLDLFLLPYFRERTFSGKGGRLRPDMLIDTDNATYESGNKERNVDYAARYSVSIGEWDIGVSHFYGTGREPSFNLGFDAIGAPVLIPHYVIINQTGLDVQLVTGSFLWKLEAIYRTGQGDSFTASASGFEYTYVGLLDTSWDIGLLAEWIQDDRVNNATTIFRKAMMIGARLTPNDAEGTEMLLGMYQDMDHSSTLFRIEASRRIDSRFKAFLEIGAFTNMDSSDLLYQVRNDGYLKVQLMYYL
ncbi:FIG01201466: hypothetical protein [hydrothermal vent metagenome]|uniref:Uncharacterized protein n=1 Tax=hydrothermal vent metagenome TaxID=652676 RepID=A0A3B1BTZ0_9ZZZZ